MIRKINEGGEFEQDNPEFAFKPDEWTTAFQTGTAAAELQGSNLLEVGAGPGTNIEHFVEECGVNRLWLADYDPRVIEVAARRLIDMSTVVRNRVRLISGQSDLIKFASPQLCEVLYKVITDVAACIPQAIRPADEPEHPDDLAHYYNPEFFQEYPFNQYALGLNEALLAQMAEKMPNASAILNLGGRVGKNVLLELFQEYGFVPEVLHEAIIPQCVTTRLSFYAALEDTERANHLTGGQEPFYCEFFADGEGKTKITAREAEERRARALRKIQESDNRLTVADMVETDRVYHKIYVVKGRPVIESRLPEVEEAA